ncbi:MAG: hypothetical protein WDW38_005143 [Sanguina aurantia]
MRGVQRRADHALLTLQQKLEVKAAKLASSAAASFDHTALSSSFSSLDSHDTLLHASTPLSPPLTYTYTNSSSSSSSSSGSAALASHPLTSTLAVAARSSSGSSSGNSSSVATLTPAIHSTPVQTNRLAFVFDPSELGLSMSFGIEVFEPGHVTPLHSHMEAHELFFVLGGEGTALCNGESWPVSAGDCLVFPPTSVHGIDNRGAGRLYCLQLMSPNESFVEYVKQGGIAMGSLDDEDLCTLANSAARGSAQGHTLVIADDNMQFRSMRYECYQLAAAEGAAYMQLYLPCSAQDAVARNAGRKQRWSPIDHPPEPSVDTSCCDAAAPCPIPHPSTNPNDSATARTSSLTPRASPDGCISTLVTKNSSINNPAKLISAIWQTGVLLLQPATVRRGPLDPAGSCGSGAGGGSGGHCCQPAACRRQAEPGGRGRGDVGGCASSAEAAGCGAARRTEGAAAASEGGAAHRP